MTIDEARAFSARDKFNCASREVRMRMRVYPGWVEKGRMTKEQAERELALMRAIEDDYLALAEKDRLL
jgi:hypothetical protein